MFTVDYTCTKKLTTKTWSIREKEPRRQKPEQKKRLRKRRDQSFIQTPTSEKHLGNYVFATCYNLIFLPVVTQDRFYIKQSPPNILGGGGGGGESPPNSQKKA